MKTRRLWIGFLTVVTVSFAVLLFFGREIYRQAPPVPDRVVTTDGKLLFTGQDIKGRTECLAIYGGQEMGTVWGHGAYQAPDWSADWLHREAVFILNRMAQETDSAGFDQLSEERKASLKVLLQQELRPNTYDASSNVLTVSALRAEAIAHNSSYYAGLFTDDPAMDAEREVYSVPENSLKTRKG
ncbi:MAG: hypothetical protein R2758_02130 [Bacteroidales bacterium]